MFWVADSGVVVAIDGLLHVDVLLAEPLYKQVPLGVRLAGEESKPEDITEGITD